MHWALQKKKVKINVLILLSIQLILNIYTVINCLDCDLDSVNSFLAVCYQACILVMMFIEHFIKDIKTSNSQV